MTTSVAFEEVCTCGTQRHGVVIHGPVVPVRFVFTDGHHCHTDTTTGISTINPDCDCVVRW